MRDKKSVKQRLARQESRADLLALQKDEEVEKSKRLAIQLKHILEGSLVLKVRPSDTKEGVLCEIVSDVVR